MWAAMIDETDQRSVKWPAREGGGGNKSPRTRSPTIHLVKSALASSVLRPVLLPAAVPSTAQPSLSSLSSLSNPAPPPLPATAPVK